MAQFDFSVRRASPRAVAPGAGCFEMTFCGKIGIIQMVDNWGRARHSVRAASCQPARSAGRGLPALPHLFVTGQFREKSAARRLLQPVLRNPLERGMSHNPVKCNSWTSDAFLNMKNMCGRVVYNKKQPTHHDVFRFESDRMAALSMF